MADLEALSRPISPVLEILVPPTAITEVLHGLTVRSTADLASALGSSKPD